MLIGSYPLAPGCLMERPGYQSAMNPMVRQPLALSRIQAAKSQWPVIPQHAFTPWGKRKQALAHQYAEQFCQATVDQFGTDEKAVKRILKDVHRLHLHREFNQAVMVATRSRDKEAQGVIDVLEREFAANPMEKPFKNAIRKECMDYLQYGKNFYRPSAWDYRLYGMYRSLADFANVCKQHPVMSASVIGSVAVLGHLYPFVGAVSGVAILAWAGAFTAMNEVQARRQDKTNADKAAHYTASGENMAAFAITAIGGKGIKEGTQNGIKVYNRTVSQTPQPASVQDGVKSRAKGLWNATKARAEGEHKTNALESFLFVSGLFDNVLLPFNALADNMDSKPKGKSS